MDIVIKGFYDKEFGIHLLRLSKKEKNTLLTLFLLGLSVSATMFFLLNIRGPWLSAMLFFFMHQFFEFKIRNRAYREYLLKIPKKILAQALLNSETNGFDKLTINYIEDRINNG